MSKHNETDRRKIHVPLQITNNSYKKKGEIQDPRSQTNDQSVSLKSNREDQSRNGKRKAQAETNKPDGKNWRGGSSCLLQRRVLAADANADWTAMPSWKALLLIYSSNLGLGASLEFTFLPTHVVRVSSVFRSMRKIENGDPSSRVATAYQYYGTHSRVAAWTLAIFFFSFFHIYLTYLTDFCQSK